MSPETAPSSWEPTDDEAPHGPEWGEHLTISVDENSGEEEKKLPENHWSL